MKKILTKSITIIAILSMVGLIILGYSIFNKIRNIPMEVESGNNLEVSSLDVEKIKGIDIDKSIIDKQQIANYTEMLNGFYKVFANEDMYLNAINNNNSSDIEKYINSLSEYIESNYLKEIVSKPTDNVIVDTLKLVHTGANNHIDSLTLVAIDRKVVEDEEVTSALVDLNSIGDKPGFLIKRLSITIDSSNKIKNIEMMDNIHEQENTTTPLSQDNYFNGSVGQEFLKEFNLLKSKMSDLNLYNKITENNLNENSPEWETFIEGLNVNKKDKTALFELFKISKANFENYGFVSYEHSYINVEPITLYNLKISDGKNIEGFKITFKRTTNEIVSIELL